MSASLRARAAGCFVAAALMMLTGGSALGYFTTTGAGLASASVSSLSKPAFTTVSAGSGGSVTLNWGAVAAPGAGAVSYYVKRDGNSVAGNCPNAGSPSAATVCIDQEVPPGTHTYVVTAVWSTWSAASAPETVTVSAGPAARLALSASSTTLIAGTAVNLTITAQDSFGNTATSYTGSKNLTFSGASASPGGNAPTVTNASGTAIAFGTATPITFASGVATISGTKNGVMTLYKAGATSIAVSDGTISTASPLALTVAATTASKLAFTHVTASAGTLSSPCYFTCTATTLGNLGTIKGGVAVTDTYGNVISGLGSGHSVLVTTTGGTLVGGTIAIPASGAAESAVDFLYTAPINGNYTNTLKAATSAGTVYTNATIVATK